MAQKIDAFEWSPVSTEAAQLLSACELDTVEIAERLGIGRSTLYRWRQHPDFVARVEQDRDELCREIRRHGIAIIERRVAALNSRWQRCERLIQARSIEHADVPGGDTGLLVRQEKMIGQGEFARHVEEYAVDTGLLKEMREHEKQAAQELGQWVEKGDVTTGGNPIDMMPVVYIPDNGRYSEEEAGDPAAIRPAGDVALDER